MNINSADYKSLFDNNPDMACILNGDGIIIEINQQMAEYLGGTVVGRHFNELLFNEDTTHSMKCFEEALRGKIINELDILEDKNGNPIHIKYKSIPIIEENTVKGLFVIGKDITTKHRMESRMKKDLEIAAAIQRSVLCRPIKSKNIQITGHYEPVFNIGGDMYVWYQIDDHRFGVLILDVMGHGVSSALISMTIRSLLEPLIMNLQKPARVIEEINSYMFRLFNSNTDQLRFLTVIYLVIDLEKKEIEYVNAGHPPGVLLEGKENYLLSPNCPPLGMMETVSVFPFKLSYKGRAKLILFTDGLLEHFDKSSIKNSISSISENFQKDNNLTCSSFVERILERAEFGADHDDLTIIKVDIH